MLEAKLKKQLKSTTPHGIAIDVKITAGRGVTVLFGRSGAGKTLCLRMLSGILAPDEGKIALDGETYFDSSQKINLSIQKRRVGYVFQNCSLFPHITVEQNVMYGLRQRRLQSTRDQVQDLLRLLGVGKLARRYPREISGGEQQRVAVARALASDPVMMLLDEPFSGVDAPTRARILDQLVTLPQTSEIPFIYVTHNHSEAVRVGESILVMDEGKILQSGKPQEIFNAPRSLQIARAIGHENVIGGTIAGHKPDGGITSVDVDGVLLETPHNGLPVGSRAFLGLRSEDVIVARERLTQTSARNVLEGSVKAVLQNGCEAEIVVYCGFDLKVSITPETVDALSLREGTPVYLLIKARSFYLLP